jgi:hypothetical protein
VRALLRFHGVRAPQRAALRLAQPLLRAADAAAGRALARAEVRTAARPARSLSTPEGSWSQ